MQIIFGPDAPLLEEQGLDLFINCDAYQDELDALYRQISSGSISDEFASQSLSKIAERITNDIGDILDKCVGPFVISIVSSNMIH